MPPRLKIPSKRHTPDQSTFKLTLCRRCRYATAAAITPSPSISELTSSPPPISYPPTQPPSHRRPEYRRSQLLRQYVSLLKTTPLILLFQHNNVRSTEWVHIRRELTNALRKVDDSLTAQNPDSDTTTAAAATPQSDAIKLQIVQTNMFEPALRIAEYYHPEEQEEPSFSSSSPNTPPTTPTDPSLQFTHTLSSSAYTFVQPLKHHSPLSPLLLGPLALLTFPTLSPLHLKAALQILSPSAPAFPAPTRRSNPRFYEAGVQDSVKKLMLLGARVSEPGAAENRVFDTEGTRWIGGIEGGMPGLRGRLVGMLQGIAGGVVGVLEGAGRSLYLTVEGRRGMLDDEEQQQQQQKRNEGEGEAGSGSGSTAAAAAAPGETQPQGDGKAPPTAS